jgi:hypothetical protein
MKEELSSSETSVLTRVTWHNIPEDAILETDVFAIIIADINSEDRTYLTRA